MMHLGDRLVDMSIRWPKRITAVMVIATLILGAMMVRVKVDTDPENMLSHDEAVRLFHDRVKADFDLHDVVVVGVVNESDPDGVFNPATLARVHDLTEFAKTLADPEHPDKRVVARNIIAPGTIDAIEQAGLGQVRFDWLMATPPQTREEALRIRKLALSNPLLNGTLVSEDGKALAIYLPITEKDFAYSVRKALMERIATFDGSDQFYITGLPVAEDTFGVEMFVQMAISAPLAMLAIFLLMYYFFRNVRMIVSPMIIAMVSVICTMGLLIGTGNTVHIMSSMIPIFLMPIAVVDSIHILSEFFDRYQQTHDREKTLRSVMKHLFMPMLYTSLTSTTGFASLALTPIPPVRVFGIFVAFGIMLAWGLTIVFIPSYIMLLSEKSLDNFGARVHKSGVAEDGSAISRFLRPTGRFTYLHAKVIIILAVAALGVAGYGISKIRINDNPVKWFHEGHEIRVADRVLNAHFGGTYEAYLVLENAQGRPDRQQTISRMHDAALESIGADAPEVADAAAAVLKQAEADTAGDADPEAFTNRLKTLWEARMDAAPDAEYDIWADALDAISQAGNQAQVFKRPAVLNYISELQNHMAASGVVGKSNSVSDLVKKVHQELFEGDPKQFTIPGTVPAVAQTLISFQNSHKPDDLWHLVTPDYTRANIWVQLKTGDNADMEAVVKRVERYFKDNPPPVPLNHQWAGLTYLNVVWQDKMVTGMLNSFLSSFAVVLVMMIILFRSPLWGFLAMVPLSVTIALIYGIIGLIGKDYDMPVAVLSSLTLGLAVDFAIHFLERSRETFKATGSWREAIGIMFEEPARAITRNIIVIAVGFTPLLLAPLVPYQTVGIFLASIMAISGVATILILPALIAVLERWLFRTAPSADAGRSPVTHQNG